MNLELSLSAEQEAIRDQAHEFAEREMRPVAADFDEREELPWEVMRRAHQLGIGASAGFPARHGGGGIDICTNIVLHEELTWGDAGMAVAINASALAGTGILAMGTEAQRERYIRMLCQPDELRLAATALTEPESGSDALALSTTATRVEGGYLLNGTKQFCTNGGIADLHLVFATTDRSLGSAGIAGFVVEKGNPGLRQGRRERKLGIRAAHTAQVILKDCLVPEDARLGHDAAGNLVGPGAAGAMLMLETSRPMIAAGAVGLARAAYEHARDHALRRHQFGKPIARHQAIAFKLADMATEIDAARLLTWRAGWMIREGLHLSRGEGSMAKLFAGDVAMRTAVEAVQILGGYGYMKGQPVERYFRDAKVYQIWEGTAEIQRLVISRHLLGERETASRRTMMEVVSSGA